MGAWPKSWTGDPVLNIAVQVVGQLMPAGLLWTWRQLPGPTKRFALAHPGGMLVVVVVVAVSVLEVVDAGEVLDV